MQHQIGRRLTRVLKAGCRLAYVAPWTMVLSACVTPDPPKYSDPMEGLSRSVVGQNIPATGRLSVSGPAAIVVSENTERFLKRSEDVDSMLKGIPIQNTSAIKDQNPAYLVDRTVELIKARASRVELVDDLASAKKGRFKTTVLVDLQVELGKLSGQTTKVAINLIVFDEKQRAVARIASSGQATIPYPAFSYGFREAADQALADLQSKLASGGA